MLHEDYEQFGPENCQDPQNVGTLYKNMQGISW